MWIIGRIAGQDTGYRLAGQDTGCNRTRAEFNETTLGRGELSQVEGPGLPSLVNHKELLPALNMDVSVREDEATWMCLFSFHCHRKFVTI
jgi:hypothetical protein